MSFLQYLINYESNVFHLNIMISCLLSCAHQTHDKINAYHVNIISFLYPTSYHILSISYADH